MPYKSTKDIPANLQELLPNHAEEIYKETFNSALDEYEGDERKAYATAWSAVKKKYKKNDTTGKWEPKKKLKH